MINTIHGRDHTYMSARTSTLFVFALLRFCFCFHLDDETTLWCEVVRDRHIIPIVANFCVTQSVPTQIIGKLTFQLDFLPKPESDLGQRTTKTAEAIIINSHLYKKNQLRHLCQINYMASTVMT